MLTIDQDQLLYDLTRKYDKIGRVIASAGYPAQIRLTLPAPTSGIRLRNTARGKEGLPYPHTYFLILS